MYGSTLGGGGTGTLYRAAPDGSTYTTIYNFSALTSGAPYLPVVPGGTNADGAYPMSTLMASNGELYGTTMSGGAFGYGALFQLNLAALGPPQTSLSLSGKAGTSGWYLGPVRVTLTATDPSDTPGSPGSFVAATDYTLDGGSQQTYTPGHPFTVTGDGRHTLVYWSIDDSGNVEKPHSTVIRVDAGPPTVIWSAPSPKPNSAGWINMVPVTVAFKAVDPVSGVASVSPASPLTFTSAGAAQTQGVTVTDNAGNTVTVPSPPVNIDITPPVTTASTSGTNPVAVTLSAKDDLSGVKATYYTVTPPNGTAGPKQTYTWPFNVSVAGTSIVTYWSVDVAGNVENAHTLTVQVAALPNLQVTAYFVPVDWNDGYFDILITNLGAATAPNVIVNSMVIGTNQGPYSPMGPRGNYGSIAPYQSDEIFLNQYSPPGSNSTWTAGQTYSVTVSGTYGSGTPWTSTISLRMP